MEILFVDVNLLNDNVLSEIEVRKYSYVFGILESQNLGEAQKLAQDSINKVNAIAVAQDHGNGSYPFYSARIFIYAKDFTGDSFWVSPIAKSVSLKNIMASILLQAVETERNDIKISFNWCPSSIVSNDEENNVFYLMAPGRLEKLSNYKGFGDLTSLNTEDE